jgi:CheY-like chemotaxis protein
MSDDERAFTGLTVLVVDDEPDVRFVVRKVLERVGFAVVEASHGAAALVEVAKLRPDAVITDRMMPLCGGDELIRQLRADETTATIPIVMVSGTSSPEAGADAALIKPFDPDELVALLGELIAKRR